MAKPQLWPIFICYRRADGSAAARRLHEMLDQWQTADPDSTTIQVDAYLDETVPGVADWQQMHRPYLEKARALIVVCTPGAKLNEGPGDWVHREINWWLENRNVAPILIDPLMEGGRYVPEAIARRWPNIQRITLVEQEWLALSGAALEEKTAAVRRLVLGAILPSGAEVYAQELEAERRRARRLRLALVLAVVLLFATAAAALYAREKQLEALENERVALLNERVGQATLLDARAADQFAQSRRIEARRDVERVRLRELQATLQGLGDSGQRLSNIEHEVAQLQDDLSRAGAEAKGARTRGREFLSQANEAWDALAAEGHDPAAVGRAPAEPPHIFSVELINAGSGESLLVHYGTRDDLRLVMINAGPRHSYREIVERRLRELGEQRFAGGPVPLELFIVGDRDEDKTGGLARMLEHLAKVEAPEERLVELRGVWANIFRADGARLSMRPRIRRLIDDLDIPLNRPFDRLVVRPEEGRVVVPLAGGLEIVVLGPKLESVRILYDFARRSAERKDQVIETFPNEGFSGVEVEQGPAVLARPTPPNDLGERCRASENARALAGGGYLDQSAPNLASTVALFRYRGKTFLYTGDARGDHILDGLATAGLLDEGQPAHADLMSIPHLGSDRNITLDFFERVQAENYLFSGDGRHGNPEVSTVASLIAARGCDRYRMWFVNREGEGGAEGEHGARFDAFFAEEAQFAPNYRRIFRSASRGSIIVDLLEPVRD